MNVSENLFSAPSLYPSNLMNTNNDYSHSPSHSSTDSLPSSTQDPQIEINQPPFSPVITNTSNYTYPYNYHPPPPPRLPPIHHRRKRTKILRIGDSSTSAVTSLSLSLTKPISKRKPPGKKPNSNAPLITHPCTECGKKFWSWKALFGHMRCHPERQWRGIKPPPNFRRQVGFTENAGPSNRVVDYTEEEHEVAQCLLFLASGSAPSGVVDYYGEHVDNSFLSRAIVDHDPNRAIVVHDPGPSSSSYQFECSGCKKVFGSHQALGGHRASHKNTKGCFAITTRNEGSGGDVPHEVFDERGGDEGGIKVVDKGLGHRCSICFKGFPSGQALGGHMRCHWEKGEGTSSPQQGVPTSRDGFLLDLNLPAPAETGGNSSSSSSSLALDLHLGI